MLQRPREGHKGSGGVAQIKSSDSVTHLLKFVQVQITLWILCYWSSSHIDLTRLTWTRCLFIQPPSQTDQQFLKHLL